MRHTHLEWPFFRPDHRDLFQRLIDWTGTHAASLEASEADVDAATQRIALELGRAGWLRYLVKSAWGGPADEIESRNLCLIREAIAYHSGLADCVFAIQGLSSVPISLFGSAELQREFLPGIVSGEKCGSFALSEAEAGSDVASLSTAARAEGTDFVLNGSKAWISNSSAASHHVVFARTGPAPGAKGLSAFVVPASVLGVRITESLNIIAPHSIGSIEFKDCRIPRQYLLGNIGDGFKIAMSTLDVFRPTVGAAALGMARRALREAVEYAGKREVFGSMLGRMQATQFRIADMQTDVDSAALLVYRAAWAKDSCERRITLESAMSKMYATEAAQRVIDSAVQLYGGLGVTVGSVVERLYREIRPLRIYEGTTEIQKLIIGTQVLRST